MRISRFLLLAGLVAVLAGSAFGAEIFNVDPTGTYLRTEQSGYSDPLFINLGDLGLFPGMQIWVQTLGDSCYWNGGDCDELEFPLAAIFVETAEVNSDISLLQRLNADDIFGDTGGVAIGAANFTDPSGFATDIDDDFEVPLGAPALITIPTGANYLAVTVIDSFYGDNSDPDGDLQISIEEADTVPEPSTLVLLIPALGLLLAAARRRKSSN